jgi:carbonic anhydrase
VLECAPDRGAARRPTPEANTHEQAHRWHSALFERLVAGQSPEALFITCSDSRVEPNLITQTKPGELFILRNAGNIVPAWGAHNGAEAATIEYAIEALGIRDIIVCGHTHCGAMKAVLGDPADLAELPAVASWLKNAEATRRVMRAHYQDVSDQDVLLETCVEENVLAQIDNLRTHPAVFAALSRGKLELHAWVYSLESGCVESFDPECGQFVPVGEAGHGTPEPRELIGVRRPI